MTRQELPSPGEIRAIAREAYTYGFPLVTNYATLYKQAVDTSDKDYRAPFNTIGRTSGVATPDDTFVVTPNSDTPYTFLWADLRAEPVVITVPRIEPGRYYSGQLIDLYTFNFAYLGTRARVRAHRDAGTPGGPICENWRLYLSEVAPKLFR